MTKPHVERFSISVPADLAKQLDQMVHEKGYANRSQAICDTIRAKLLEPKPKLSSQPVMGTLTLVYDHHKRDLQNELTNIQHDYQQCCLSTLHVHLDHHHCLEILVLSGSSAVLAKMADRLAATKGVLHSKLAVTAVPACQTKKQHKQPKS